MYKNKYLVNKIDAVNRKDIILDNLTNFKDNLNVSFDVKGQSQSFLLTKTEINMLKYDKDIYPGCPNLNLCEKNPDKYGELDNDSYSCY